MRAPFSSPASGTSLLVISPSETSTIARCRSGSRSGGKAPSADSMPDRSENARIGGRWIPDRALTCEEDERDAAADHLPPELLREMPRRAQAVGFDVAR